MTSLARLHDCLLLDLDGTVFRGSEPTPGAVDTLAALDARLLYVTNNASRSAEQVADHLRELGFRAAPDDVVTSAQTAARMLAEQLPTQSKVLIIGTDSLAEEVRAVGLRPVREFADEPAAVVQGHSPQTAWSDLAEAGLAVRAGALWVAANIDKTLPSERGLLPGNGSMVAALRTATDVEPQVAGKPAPALMADALARGNFHTPLMIGDRLDTDIAGAHAAGLPSLMVLCGVNNAVDAIFAVADQRPDMIAEDLRALNDDADHLRVGPHPAWRIEFGDHVSVSSTGEEPGDELSIVRAIAAAVWEAAAEPERSTIVTTDDAAREAAQRWSLLDPAID